MTTYLESGINIEFGDFLSSYIYNRIKETWIREDIGKILVPFDDFSGLRMIDISSLSPNTVMGMNFDGIGTKVEIAERINVYNTLGHDLVAMVSDDAARFGAEPILLGSVIDSDTLSSSNFNNFKSLVDGYIDAAKTANMAIINGEIAELGNRINGKGNLNLSWNAGCIWLANKDNLITGKNVSPNDWLVGLKEEGFRSNGLSLVRKIIDNNAGIFTDFNLLQDILKPSTIYAKAIVEMTGGYRGKPSCNISGIAHITGGGLYGKLKRMLKPSGYGAAIVTPFEIPKIFKNIMDIGNVSIEEAYKTWNMGIGMVISTLTPHKVIEIAKKHNIEAQVIGNIISSDDIKIYFPNET